MALTSEDFLGAHTQYHLFPTPTTEEQRREQRDRRARLRTPVWMGGSTCQPGRPTGPGWHRERSDVAAGLPGVGPGLPCGVHRKHTPTPMLFLTMEPLLKTIHHCSFKDQIQSRNGYSGISVRNLRTSR